MFEVRRELSHTGKTNFLGGGEENKKNALMSFWMKGLVTLFITMLSR
jgi:hypothetical protein